MYNYTVYCARLLDSIFSNASATNSEAETNQVLRELDLPVLNTQQQASLIQRFSAEEISLFNTIYKCIAKRLVLRTKPILSSLVSSYHHIFLFYAWIYTLECSLKGRT